MEIVLPPQCDEWHNVTSLIVQVQLDVDCDGTH